MAGGRTHAARDAESHGNTPPGRLLLSIDVLDAAAFNGSQ